MRIKRPTSNEGTTFGETSRTHENGFKSGNHTRLRHSMQKVVSNTQIGRLAQESQPQVEIRQSCSGIGLRTLPMPRTTTYELL